MEHVGGRPVRLQEDYSVICVGAMGQPRGRMSSVSPLWLQNYFCIHQDQEQNFTVLIMMRAKILRSVLMQNGPFPVLHGYLPALQRFQG